MSDHNPYAAPQSSIAPPLDPWELPFASRVSRFFAALVDGIILGVVNYGITLTLAPKVDQAWAQEVMRTKGFEEGMKEVMAAANPGFATHLLMLGLMFAAYVGINWVFLKSGQTIGKKLLKIQVQDQQGGLLPVKDLVLKRFLPIQLAASLPALIHPYLGMVGGLIVLIDALCIFRSRYNTLHDDIAKSKVVKLPA